MPAKLVGVVASARTRTGGGTSYRGSRRAGRGAIAGLTRPNSGEIAQQEILVFSLQLVVALLTFGQCAAFFLDRLLEIANSFLKVQRHFRDGWCDRITELNLKLVFVD